jgi:hypothetical protein
MDKPTDRKNAVLAVISSRLCDFRIRDNDQLWINSALTRLFVNLEAPTIVSVAKLGEPTRRKSVVVSHLTPYINEILIDYGFMRAALPNDNARWDHNAVADIISNWQIATFEVVLRTKCHVYVPANIPRRKVAPVVNATVADDHFIAGSFLGSEWNPWLNPNRFNVQISALQNPRIFYLPTADAGQHNSEDRNNGCSNSNEPLVPDCFENVGPGFN